MTYLPTDDPIALLLRYQAEAQALGVPLPEAMTLATVGADGAPHARIVLFKGMRGRALTFFTNYESDKGRELEANPRAALVFHFAAQERQVRVEGVVTKLSASESDEYFATRPRASQLGAWASAQSRPLEDRATLDRRFVALSEEYRDRAVPRPAHWGGYALEPGTIELWSGQVGRMHDRARWVSRPGGWEFTLLQP
ncbi:MAG TPA: pyridoxamine 5'-phosphate oxidase [Polyangiaceae bacterium]|nr:pyridoxamine 5'-phosphate oxidase [Polyangiaceae bacterium]